MELYYTPPPTIKKEVKSHTVTIYLVLLKIIKGHVALDWVIWGYKKRLLWNELKFLWLCFRQMHRRLQLKSTIGFLSQIRQMSNQFHFHAFELKLFCLSSCYCVSYSEFDHSISFWVESNSFVTLMSYLAYRHSFSWHTRLKKRLRIWMLFWWILLNWIIVLLIRMTQHYIWRIIKRNRMTLFNSIRFRAKYNSLVVKLAAHLPKLTEKTYIIRVRNYLFLKNYRLLQREPFLTICYSINSSPLLITK